MAKKQAEEDPALDVPVLFGGVSIGQAHARLSMKVARETMRITQADKAFCGRRLTGLVQLGGGDDSPGQGKMFDTEMVVEGTFDIHRFGVSEDFFTTGATFKLKEIDVGELAKFSKGKGRLIASSIDLIPEDVVEEDTEPAAGRIPGQFKADGPWRKHQLDGLFSGAILKSLKTSGIDTVGDLHDYLQPDKNGYCKQLTDLKGVGESKAEHIADIMMDFWADNPEVEEKLSTSLAS